MCTKFDSVSEISPEKETWTIMARVVRLWLVADFSKQKIPFSMELVLVDDKGDRIHASIRGTLIYRFKKDLKEGFIYSFQFFGVASNGGSYRTCYHPYKLKFQFQTRVVLLDNYYVPTNLYALVSIPEITLAGFDTDYLVDVMGLLIGVGTEREIERNGIKTKLNVICLEVDGHRIECTLFGSYVDELNTFLAVGDVQNVVIIVQFGKVKTFKEKNHLQNCMNCTKLVFNPTCAEAVQLRNRMNETKESPTPGLSQLIETPSVGLSEDFLQQTPRRTIKGLKDCKEVNSCDSDSCSVVLATVKHIVDDEWYYTACICGKSVYPDHKTFFCEKCDKHVMKVFQRYCIKRAGQGSIPNEINGLVDKSFLFKVELWSEFSGKFEQSFRVKKVCSDAAILNKFNDLYLKSVEVKSENVLLGGGKQLMVEGSEIGLKQNLMGQFSQADGDMDSQLDAGCDLSRDSQEISPLKRDIVVEHTLSEVELSLKMLKKSIKIEKD